MPKYGVYHLPYRGEFTLLSELSIRIEDLIEMARELHEQKPDKQYYVGRVDGNGGFVYRFVIGN